MQHSCAFVLSSHRILPFRRTAIFFASDFPSRSRSDCLKGCRTPTQLRRYSVSLCNIRLFGRTQDIHLFCDPISQIMPCPSSVPGLQENQAIGDRRFCSCLDNGYFRCLMSRAAFLMAEDVEQKPLLLGGPEVAGQDSSPTAEFAHVVVKSAATVISASAPGLDVSS